MLLKQTDVAVRWDGQAGSKGSQRAVTRAKGGGLWHADTEMRQDTLSWAIFEKKDAQIGKKITDTLVS